MYIICVEKRWEYWNHFVARWAVEGVGGGSGVTGARLRKVQQVILDDDEFWQDVVGRHSGRDQIPELLQMYEPGVYERRSGPAGGCRRGLSGWGRFGCIRVIRRIRCMYALQQGVDRGGDLWYAERVTIE